MKTLTINQKVFKHQDTQTKLKIALFEDDSRVSLDSDVDYQLKIKNASGYLKSEKLTIEDNRLVLTTDKFKDLTPDDYLFEVWADEDSIYPSDSYGYFKITKNTTEVDGETIPVITIEDFEKRIDEALKKVESIEQIKGEKGERGPQGLQGPVGPQGPKGERGEVGPKGEKGDTGLQGEKGNKGDTGERGADGKDGTNGVDGKNGQDGKSAYQIWLDLGNSGSEQDFINSLKAQSERHAPTGYILNTSSEPWTLVFDNGCILDDVWHWNNNVIFRPENNGNINNRSIPTYSIPDLIMKVIRGVLIPSDFQTYNGGWFDQKTRIINPVNDAEEYDWNSITPEKKRRFIRCMYELGIWGGATVESFGAVRKAGN